MKNKNTDSTTNVSRFARDKRQRVNTAERVERSPRPRREADNEGYAARGGRRDFGAAKRASFNPNFSEDNRVKGRSERSFGERNYGERNYGERSFGERNFSEGRQERTERRSGGERTFGAGKPKSGGRNGAAQRRSGEYGGKKFSQERPSAERTERTERGGFNRTERTERTAQGTDCNGYGR